VFASLNAVMEELWFRGIFLRPFSEVMGGTQAVVVTAIIFAAAHVAATYTNSVGEQLLLVSLAIAIGFEAGWAMRWGQQPVGVGSLPHGLRPSCLLRATGSGVMPEFADRCLFVSRGFLLLAETRRVDLACAWGPGWS
jgi:membrane protease YdiL (CAAX protease family)